MPITKLKELLEHIENDTFPTDSPVEISLENEIITRSEMEKLTNVLKEKPISLRALSLKSCGLDDQDVKNLMEALSYCPRSLSTLDLSDNNKIGQEGALSIAKALENENIHQISYLHLDGTNIEDIGMKCIANTIVANNNKVGKIICCRNSLTLSGTKATMDTLKEKSFYITVNTDTAKEDKEIYDAIKDENIHFGYKSNLYQRGIVTLLPDKQFELEIQLIKKQLNKKIDFLTEKYGNSTKIKVFASALQTLSNAVNEDITAQLDLDHDLRSAEARQISNSPAMVILRNTNNMLEKVLKEGDNLPQTVNALTDYATNCQHAIEQQTFWQQLVGGIIYAALAFLSIINPASGPIILPLLYMEAKDVDPLHALYLIAKDLRKSLPEAIPVNTTFFTPYSKFVSDVEKAADAVRQSVLQNDNTITDDEPAKRSQNPAK